MGLASASVSIGIATSDAHATLHFSAQTPVPTLAQTPAATYKPLAVPTASAVPKSGKNSTSPYVQVSVARKEQWTLVYMTLGMGAVGLLMATF